MNILLDGYFDKNFGDDAMQYIIVENLNMHDFYVNPQQKEMLAHLEGFPNVHIGEKMPTIDVYVNIIGTGFLYNGKRAATEKILSMIFSQRKNHSKSAVIDCSVEPIHGKVSHFLTKHELRRYGLICCRDNISFKYISKSCPHSDVHLHNDIVFALPQKYIFKSDDECLGVSVSRRLYSDENYNYYRAVAKSCDNYINNYGKKVLLFAFDSGLENDISACLSVKKMMKNSDMAEIIAYNSDIEKFLKDFSRCSVFIGSRFHSVVSALVYEIPVVAVCDTHKLENLCMQFNVPMTDRKTVTSEILDKVLEETKAPIIIDKNISKDAEGHMLELKSFIEG